MTHSKLLLTYTKDKNLGPNIIDIDFKGKHKILEVQGSHLSSSEETRSSEKGMSSEETIPPPLSPERLKFVNYQFNSSPIEFFKIYGHSPPRHGGTQQSTSHPAEPTISSKISKLEKQIKKIKLNLHQTMLNRNQFFTRQNVQTAKINALQH